jgi:hypothetical protein
VPALLDLLKSPHYRWRYQAKRELHERSAAEVKAALDAWVAKLDPKDARFRHHQTEALWTYRTISTENNALLTELLNCDEHHARAAATQQLRYIALPRPHRAAPHQRANDDNALVRMEAVIAASYIGTQEALDAVLRRARQAHGRPFDLCHTHRTRQRGLVPSLEGDGRTRRSPPSWKPSRRTYKRGPFERAKTAEETAFDKQPGVARITISCVRERMLYDKTEFSVKRGQPVSLVFNNPDATAHNLAICKPGSTEEVGMAGNEMAKDPEGIKKDFIPANGQDPAFTPSC